MRFEDMRLIEPLLRAIRGEGYTTPTAIQKLAIPPAAEGKDLIGCAQTGTGKTAAFALPILQRLHRRVAEAGPPPKHSSKAVARRPIRSLILTPTRELAAQIGESFRVYGRYAGLRHTVIYGGVKQHSQCDALRRGVDILVATPGRLLDLHNQRLLSLNEVEVFVLDEADRMLDMGFLPDIRRVIALLPERRQTMLFSATMPREIRALADTILREPVMLKVAAKSVEADNIEQAVYLVDARSKPELLVHLLQNPKLKRILVFSRTKRGADRITIRMTRSAISAEAIHSDKSQNARMRALLNFKEGRTRVLVASDIASRGLDVDEVSHVINYDLPNEAETYVHRIGRTGRAGARGQAISFCSGDERDNLRGIERLLGKTIAVLPHSIAAPARSAPGKSAASTKKPAFVMSDMPAGRPRGRTTAEEKKDAFWQKRRKRRKPVVVGAKRSKRRAG
jgi:ATP-dependent RNA helicase RhlE